MRQAGQASSAVAMISPSALVNSNPASGRALPRSATLRQRSRTSGRHKFHQGGEPICHMLLVLL